MSNRLISWILFIVLCLIWGSSFILMKNSKEGLTAIQIAAVRIFSGGLVFLPLAFFHYKKIARRKMGTVALAGLFGNFLPAFLFAIAIVKKIDSSLAGIFNSLTPIWVVVISLVFFRDKIGKQKIAGVLIGFAGLCVLSLSQNNINLEQLGYSMVIVLATIFYGINVNLYSHYLREQSAIHVTTVSLAIITIPSAFILWQQGFLQLDFSDPVVRSSLLASVVLGIAGTSIATALFYILVKKAGALFASLVTYGIPFVALFWGFLYGEKITIIEIVCLMIILAGVYLANRREK